MIRLFIHLFLSRVKLIFMGTLYVTLLGDQPEKCFAHFNKLRKILYMLANVLILHFLFLFRFIATLRRIWILLTTSSMWGQVRCWKWWVHYNRKLKNTTTTGSELQCTAQARSVNFVRLGVVDDAKQIRNTSSWNPQASEGSKSTVLSDFWSPLHFSILVNPGSRYQQWYMV